ncbi:hypothetical protein JHK82_039739 [Glycine max]|nr:hypothetical protein JHK86_039930 [Glycine max]KAG4965537.1 hypothetical protein JHK85_040512 [Glycine max]KAG5110516.1 hypothetical protein JHK82_039739 [Glycine max]KAG5121805.1 hypothetical protein JHK84_040145 [Glycine max]
MANFLAGFIGNDQTTSNWWSLDIDSASNVKGSREKIILEGPDNVTLEQALKLNFKASNNQAEYEALIAGIGWQSNTKNMERHPPEVLLQLTKCKTRCRTISPTKVFCPKRQKSGFWLERF